MGWRKALRLQHMSRLQRQERQKRPRNEVEVSTERKRKRARCLIELQEDEEEDAKESESRRSATIVEEPIVTDSRALSPVEITVKSEPQQSHDQRQPEAEQVEEEMRPELHCITPSNSVSERLQIVEASKQTHAGNDALLSTLRASNVELMEENASLKQQLQRQKADTRMVQLLQEQVQRLQQRELELMRALIGA